MTDLWLPLLKRHYCLICEKWIINSATSEGDALFVHDDKIHPENIMPYIADRETWN